MEIRPLEKTDLLWLESQWVETWGSREMISKGKKIILHDQRGFIATEISVPIGFLTYQEDMRNIEITSLLAKKEQAGVGKMLIEQVKETARFSGVERVWLVTTNDNTHALEFYQKHGFSICGIRENVMDEYRKMKPEIPVTGYNGIPVRDEIELEFRLK